MPPTTRSSKRRATEGPLGTPEPSHLATVPEDETHSEFGDGRPGTPESDIEPDPKPAQKRKKGKSVATSTQAPKRAKIKGKLEIFKNVPVEVFIQIAKYLHPFDLVLLSRVNKFFRELFMSRQAASIWVSARRNVPNLPPCPPALSPKRCLLNLAIFSQHCGKYAPRHMDPMLLVRLCTSCWEEQYRLMSTIDYMPYMSLVARSYDPPPRKFRHYDRLLLISDVEAVESKLKELSAAGDNDSLARWKSERREELEARYRNAGLFKEWFAERDLERGNDLNQRKNAHEAEVEARLISLGWEREDHLPSDYTRRKKWNSLVRAPRSLTDRGWDKLLPQLIVHLEENRKVRLARERADRRQERNQELREFWNTTKKLLPPLLEAVPQQEDIEVTSLPSTVVKDNILHQAFPAFMRMQEWSEYTQLLEEDIPAAELKLKLEDKQDSLNEFIRKWKTQLEEQMIRQLPDHIEPPNFNAPGLSLTSNTQPVDSLFAGTQMLLRGDVTFKASEYDYCKFYPDDFEDLYATSRISYDINSSAIAADLLRALERPGATYLEMKSLGPVFQCGKCHVRELMNWKGLVGIHYF
ncbi:putative exocyst complex component sec8 [Neurospora crassa OR74A] [Rhizoctonia solani]|uniref:Putative exocyst complex component sec8 [Neurospora crassa OR74A] n=1 Tax=Rhizoctonia solani TaxID=456999 RepID=A0A0K6FYH4_9AGAM|nr:putative exocyst complex component sec8 [Neurospora crassa OR74A] [Rhizoctonia solani]